MRPPPERRASVWIIDDSRVQAAAVRRALEPRYDVSVYESGLPMLEALSSSRPDVLVLDWHMPDISGREVCQFVRRTLNQAELPILVLTALGTPETVLEALSAGANDFLRSPFSDAELDARVSGLVHITSLHAQLVNAEQRLRVEAEFREQFMGMLAHDLRQPLSTIAMASQAVAHLAPLPEKASVYLAMQVRAAERMTRMIAELLDFTRSRPESGMPIARELIDFAEVARASVEEIRIVHPDRLLKLSVVGPSSGHWDRDRLAQICSNLLGNAFEHGSADTPVEVALASRGDHVELSVQSSGSAIPEDVLATLFQPFRRARGHRKPGSGVGLGLHIVNQIVRAHGGTITVDSEHGVTRFIVSLPREASTVDTEP